MEDTQQGSNLQDVVAAHPISANIGDIKIRQAAHERFLHYLVSATPKIDDLYLRLPIAGSNVPKYRERVYCYELYHRMRYEMERTGENEYAFNGEVDKNGHPLFVNVPCAKGKIPDFLTHIPGNMDGNLVVMEVKSIRCTKEGINKDLETILCFLRKMKYHKGILLIYGDNTNWRTGRSCGQKKIATVQRWAEEWRNSLASTERLADIELWWHRTSNEPMHLENW